MADDRPVRQQVEKRWDALKQERSSWISHWQDLSQWLQPRSGRFFPHDRNRGERRNRKIINNVATLAARTLASGMKAGMTSEAQPWFEITTADRDLAESPEVKQWLSDVTEVIRAIFSRSNLYRSLHSGYRELGVFGTSAKIMLPDFDNVAHFHQLTIGEYAIATNYRGVVDTIYHEYEKTVGEIVGEFGLENCSNTVKRLYEQRAYDTWVPIIHAIEPRRDRDHGKRDNRNMPWRSVYIEVGGDREQVLREGGYPHFPGLVSRWDVAGGDIYGDSPGMDALGDVMALQAEELRKAKAIDRMSDPPLQGPSALKNQLLDLKPGGMTFVDAVGQSSGVRNLMDVRLDISHLTADIREVERRIERAFHVDLFRMLDSLDARGQRTATEILERRQEKMVLLGPVVERQHNEELQPLIENAFAMAVEAGILPPAPPDMEGAPLEVEYVSVLARAQRANEAGISERFIQALGAVAQLGKQDALDKLDSDKWADWYAQRIGLPPDMLVAGQQLAFIRESRAREAQAMQQAALMNQAADTAQKLGNAPTQGGNALSDAITQFQE